MSYWDPLSYFLLFLLNVGTSLCMVMCSSLCAHVARLHVCYINADLTIRPQRGGITPSSPFQGQWGSHISLEDSSEGNAAPGRPVYKGGCWPGYLKDKSLAIVLS